MRREKVRPNGVILSFLVSVLAVRFLSVKWYFHYGPPVVAPLVLACLPAVSSASQRTIPKWVFRSSLVLLLAINGGELTRNLGKIFGKEAGYCEGSPERLDAVNRGMDFLSERIQGRALVEGNVLPALTARPEIYHVGGERPNDLPLTPYRYVFVEKPPRGDPWPLDHERIEALIRFWRQESVRIHFDDDYVFLAEGRFVTDR